MFKTFVLIFMISLLKCMPFVMIGANQFDPDVDFCNDRSISSGVVAEDGETYLFKGDYYWRTRPLNIDSGILGYAALTINKWPEVSTDIKLVFTVSKDNALITIFVVETKWFGYQKGVKVINGSVNSWPDFNDSSVTVAFTPLFGGTLVYILHSNNDNYILYDFTNILKPKKVRSGPTTIRENYLLFTEDSSKSMPGISIRNLIDVRAGLTYKRKLLLVSQQTYCAISLSADSYERECIPKSIDELLGCPFDLSRRPTTKSLKTTKIIETNITTEMKTISDNPIFNITTEEFFETKSSNDFYKLNEEITGITVLGQGWQFEDEELNETDSTSQSAAGIEGETIYEKNSKNSLIWFIAFVFALNAISICALLMFGIVSIFKNKKKHKGYLFNSK